MHSLPSAGHCACGGGCPRCTKESTHARIQTKLNISTPGDAREQEADRIADQIMRMPESHAAPVTATDVHSTTPLVQRQVVDGGTAVDGGTVAARAPCDATRINTLIEPAFVEARIWRSRMSPWFDAFAQHLRAKAGREGDYVAVGRTIFNDLTLLDRHFSIRDTVRRAGGSFPDSDTQRVGVNDLRAYGSVAFPLRERFSRVNLDGMSFFCEAPCPRGRVRGSHTMASAVAGSLEINFFTDCFDSQHEKAKAGIVLHEAFHATFPEFNHDSYSFEDDYPGTQPLTNAESFATFAAFAATGSGYRIRLITLPEERIIGRP